jgi:hypothetical protein
MLLTVFVLVVNSNFFINSVNYFPGDRCLTFDITEVRTVRARIDLKGTEYFIFWQLIKI